VAVHFGQWPALGPAGGADGQLFAAPFDLNRLEVRGTPVPVLEEVSYSPSFGSAEFDYSIHGYDRFLEAFVDESGLGTFTPPAPLRQAEYRSLRRHVRKTLKGAIAAEDVPVHFLLGSGGTMTSIAAMVMAMRKEGYGSIHGYEVLRSEVVHLLAMLLRKELKGRRGNLMVRRAAKLRVSKHEAPR